MPCSSSSPKVTSKIAASIMTCSSMISRLEITFLMTAISAFSPIRRMELERWSARIFVFSESFERLWSAPDVALGLTCLEELEDRCEVLRELLLRELLPLDVLLEPWAAPTSSFRVPESSSASAYSRLMTSKEMAGSTSTSNTSIILSKKAKFSSCEKIRITLVRSSAMTLTLPWMMTDEAAPV